MDFGESRECPQCRTVVTREDAEDFPNCLRGCGRITEEGLLSKYITNSDGSKTYVEVGREGLVILSSSGLWDDVATLLGTILHLETPEPTESTITDFAQASAHKWNRKRAKRRFYRWLREQENDLPPLANTQLRDLAARLMRKAHEQTDTSEGWTADDVIRWGQSGFLSNLKNYEIRKGTEPVLLVLSEVPGTIRNSLREARECYRWGLDATCFGLCRIVLDIAIRMIDETKRDASWPLPVRDEFKSLLSCIPVDLLSERERIWVSRFWTRASEFLHGKGPSPDGDDAWDALRNTTIILERLAGRGSFNHN